MDWAECCNRRIVKEVKPDEPLIASLEVSSKNKLVSSEKLPLEETTAASKLSLAYDSLRELLEAIAIGKGYKVYNHDCYSCFLKEVLKESDKGDEFDELRKARNSVNYYGKPLSVEEARGLIERIKTLRSALLRCIQKTL